MTLHYQDIMVSWIPTGRSKRGSHGRASRGRLCSTCGNVAFVSRTRLSTSIEQGCFSHYQSQNRSGKVSPWNSLQGCPRSKGEIAYMSWLINWPNSHISFLYHSITPQPRWLSYFSERSSGYTGYPRPLSVIGTVDSLVPSGRSYPG